jgi:molecular chaperone Hsp33
MGEALMSGLLLASYCKSGERVNLNITGTRKMRQAIVDANPEGNVRGYLIEAESDSGPTETHSGIWGDGLLSVLRTKNIEKKQPYIGTVPLLTGHLAKDFTFYWVQSEQVPTACGLSVTLDEQHNIKSAGAFLIQAMPGATQQEIDWIVEDIRSIDAWDQKLAAMKDPSEFLAELFHRHTYLILENRELKMVCQCSMEKVERALLLTGSAELQHLIDHHKKAEIRCDFCEKNYVVEEARLQELKRDADIQVKRSK